MGNSFGFMLSVLRKYYQALGFRREKNSQKHREESRRREF
jgi:hypothetical protein